ncbi:hypothetical protein FOVSG1_015096 [Fusarium oxysporum f. sp. vasinfectum]
MRIVKVYKTSIREAFILHLITINSPRITYHTFDKMANACAHQFRMIKSDNTLVQWICQHCRSDPHWMIWECTYCKLHLCQLCSGDDPNPSVDFAWGGFLCMRIFHKGKISKDTVEKFEHPTQEQWEKYLGICIPEASREEFLVYVTPGFEMKWLASTVGFMK